MIKIFSHKDLDGYGVNILAKLADKEIFSDIENHMYETLNERIKDFIIKKEYKIYEKVYITDLSVSEEIAEMIDELEDNNFLLIDHHVPNVNWLKKYSWCVIEGKIEDQKVSGTWLFYYEFLDFLKEKCFSESVNILSAKSVIDFVETVRLYDTWDWTRTTKEILEKYKPEELNMLLYIMGEYNFVNLFTDLLSSGKYYIPDNEMCLINLEKAKRTDYMKDILSDIIVKNYKNLKMGLVHADKYISDLGKYIMENNSFDLDFVMIVNKPKVSLRTNKDNINLCDIAKEYGGGGHPQASGFTYNEEIIKKLLT